ncbi:hypothetical protein CAEBREN_16163 [Caenorhabditis brenneri]|uniref:Metaxin glutathione S-transferase domain-containing protein n=1 Tax=Caenorhabditis brenneri TaxID=135651 RepID=G0N114_CAEBE|nr:hypothetical protein CAEBREN_16163 [Caenorhabditis brenneri]
MFDYFSILVAVILGGIIYYLKDLFTPDKIKEKPEIQKKDYKKDTVYLYQFKRLKNCPNLSPFCMKIEVLCRIWNIPHEADATVFSLLATVYYPFRTHITDVLENDFPKLLEYVERVKKEVYPNDFTF